LRVVDDTRLLFLSLRSGAKRHRSLLLGAVTVEKSALTTKWLPIGHHGPHGLAFNCTVSQCIVSG
jgi:hypothetical protein